MKMSECELGIKRNMNAKKVITNLKEYWIKQNIKINNGVNINDLFSFEQKYNILLPLDFRFYIEEINGMDISISWESDDEMITFYPLKRIKTLMEQSPGLIMEDKEKYFVFADYCINDVTYLIELKNSIDESTPIYTFSADLIKVADTFTEFVESYLRNEEGVLFPHSRNVTEDFKE